MRNVYLYMVTKSPCIQMLKFAFVKLDLLVSNII